MSGQVAVRVPGEALLLVTTREQAAQELEDVRHRGDTVPPGPRYLVLDRCGIATATEAIVEGGVVDGESVSRQLVGELDRLWLLVRRDERPAVLDQVLFRRAVAL